MTMSGPKSGLSFPHDEIPYQTITDATLDKVADAINRARYIPGGLPERGLADEDQQTQEYARRLAHAAMVAMRDLTD